MAWLVYRLTHSALMLGVIGFTNHAPNFILAPVAGWVADRYDRYKILIAMHVLAMLQATTLAVLVLTGQIQIWHLILLSLAMGVILTFEIPARQAFVIRALDDKADLGNAIALHSSVFNLARLVGPALAGVMIAKWDEGVVFSINAVSFLAVIWALLAMRLTQPPLGPLRHGAGRHVADGFRYAFGTPSIRTILMLLALVSLVGMPYVVLMPLLADRVYQGGADALGFLMGAAGCGGLVGALMLAARRSAHGLPRLALICAGVFGLALLALSIQPPWLVALGLMFLIGWCGIYVYAGNNTNLQLLVDEAQRGRVMSYFSMSILGVMPMGNLLAGAVAERLNAPLTLAICGVCCLAGTLALSRGFLSIHIPSTTPPAPLIPDPLKPPET